MKDIGLFVYPWDLADEGPARVMDFAARSGITTLYLASVYHAGLLLQPHNPIRRVYLIEDGVAYFWARTAAYGVLEPTVAAVSRQMDSLAAAAEQAEASGLRMAAWTVCMHNSLLGRRHPQAVIHDAFGNPRPYALCPSHPDVRVYIRALISDLCRYPLKSIILEAFRYMDVVHGEHHERWCIPLPSLERSLLSLSFAPSDLDAAARVGIDGAGVRTVVRCHLERFFESYPDTASELAVEWAEFESLYPEAEAYRNCLKDVMDSLLDDLLADRAERPVALIGQGEQPFNITCRPQKAGFDGVICALYGQTPEQAAGSIRLAKRKAPPGVTVYSAVRLGFGDFANLEELIAVIRETKAAGAEGLLLYNYAECPPKILNWISPAIREGLDLS